MAKRRRADTIPAQIDRGTPETRKKLTRSPMQRLIESGSVGREEADAAIEIVKVFRAVSAGLFAKQGSYGGGGAKGRAEMADWLADAHSKRYMPWARSFKSSVPVNITLSVVNDEVPLSDIDRAEHWRNGTARGVVVTSLRRYAALAGWVTGAVQEEWRRAG